MKILHITSHEGTIKNIKNVLNYLNNENNLTTEPPICNNYYIDKNTANNLWSHYKHNTSKYDILLFTDTSMIARPFLQNINDHNCLLVIYITNRFDWGIWGVTDNEYYELYANTSNHKRVVFCADNNYDQHYAKIHNINFAYDKAINLTPALADKIITYSINKFFIYNRGTQIEHYKRYLDDRNITYNLFCPTNRFKNTQHICEYKGIIHLPYQTNIQSLFENIGYFIIYFIPSKKFITELIFNTEWYYWEEKNKPLNLLIKSIELSEWYNYENEHIFEYFDSWDELGQKVNNLTDDYILNKKQIIKQFIKIKNAENVLKWKTIFEHYF